MSYAALLLRLTLAFIAGWIVYMIAAVLDVLAPVGGVGRPSDCSFRP
jgi:hypothetical protein